MTEATTDIAEISWYFASLRHECQDRRVQGWLGPSQRIYVGDKKDGTPRYRWGCRVTWKIGFIFDASATSHKTCPFCFKTLPDVIWDDSYGLQKRKCVRCGQSFDMAAMYESGRGGPPICRKCVRRRK